MKPKGWTEATGILSSILRIENHFSSKSFFNVVNKTFFTSSLFLLPIISICQSNVEPSDQNTSPLFLSEDPLDIKIEADFRELINNKDEEDPTYRSAKLSLIGRDSTQRIFEIKVKARGITRRTTDICSIPPLKLNLKKKSTQGTVFEGQNKLKLVTYCKDADLYEDYVLQEYLVYRTYNILTDTSLQVRLARITYYDTGKNTQMTTRFGFLIEDIDDLADRLGGKEIDILLPNHDMCERKTLDRFIIFQYMIGNTDWWIARPQLHNVKLISINSGAPIPIPYDFDYSGIINSEYASPSGNLPIKSVRQRIFRGFCRRKGVYEEIIMGFINRKDDIHDLYLNFPYLEDQTKKDILNYYDQFYEIIEDPRQIKQQLYDACPIRHTHLHEM